jgi:hypothetical protein
LELGLHVGQILDLYNLNLASQKNWKKYQGIDNVVSRRPFPRARLLFLPVLVAYKSSQSAPAIDTQKPSSLLRRQNLPARR